MTNNKQSSVEKMFQEMIEIQQSGKKLTFDENLALLEKYKAMHKEEQSKFTIDYFNWLHNNQYKYNPKVKMYQKMMINETLFFTIDELMMEFNKTLWGIDEKQ